MGTVNHESIKTTSEYAAPEVHYDEKIVINEKPDMFSLGVIFQEMITLTKPKPAVNMLCTSLPAGVPGPLTRVLNRMMLAYPAERIDLDHLLGELNGMGNDAGLTDSVLDPIRSAGL